MKFDTTVFPAVYIDTKAVTARLQVMLNLYTVEKEVIKIHILFYLIVIAKLKLQ